MDIIDSEMQAVTFSANGEYLLSGDEEGVQVWRVESGAHMATLEAEHVRCLAVSIDNNWIAGGTWGGSVLMWNANTYKQVFLSKSSHAILGVDYSPDSARLVTASENRTATVWAITTGNQVLSLRHENAVIAAKYSPHGERIATTTRDAVRVWDSDDGRLLVDIPLKATPWRNVLCSMSQNVVVLSDDRTKQTDPSVKSITSEWSIPGSELSLIEHVQNISSIPHSPDDRFLAMGGEDRKITITRLSRSIVGILFIASEKKLIFTLFQEPDIQVDDAVLDSWKHGELADADALLSAALSTSQSPDHHALANRALVRARLRQWGEAISDANEVSSSLPSHALTLTFVQTSPSNSCHQSLATLQKV